MSLHGAGSSIGSSRSWGKCFQFRANFLVEHLHKLAADGSRKSFLVWDLWLWSGLGKLLQYVGALECGCLYLLVVRRE